MELDWWTFVLEIVNFLVLVWILKHFFYQPVFNAIAARQANIDQQLNDAATKQQEALSLQQHYQNRLAEWEQEKGHAQQKLNEQIATQRAKLLDEAQHCAAQQLEKHQVREQQRLQQLHEQSQRNALNNATTFASRLLSRLSCPQLETHIIDMVLDELDSLPSKRVDRLRTAYKRSNRPVRIESAYVMEDGSRQQLQQHLEKLLAQPLAIEFDQQPSLIGGVRIAVDSWLLQANIADELRHFSQQTPHETK